MAGCLKVIGALVVLALAVFVSPLIGVLVGAFAGWVVGYVFPITFAVLVAKFGVAAMWQVGAILGFVGGFFKTTLNQKSD